MKKKSFLNLKVNTIFKERKADQGVTLISVLIMVIVMAIIASIAIYGGRDILKQSEETSQQETIAAIKAKVNQLSIQNSTAGVFTPANQSYYGEKATNYFYVEDYPLDNWYILEKDDLEALGVEYVDETYIVNYNTNEVYALTEFGDYIEKNGKELVEVDYSNSYVVNFHPDNEELVSGTMSSQHFVYGVPQSLNPNQYVKEGYHFIEWNTERDGTGDAYLDRATNLTVENGGSIDLYTIWQVNSYRVVFNANGGTGTTSEQSFIYNTEQNLNANSFARTGYLFGGWNTKANGTGTSYNDLASVKNLTTTDKGVVTLYAQWNANNYTVTFNAGSDAITNPSPKNVTYGNAYGDLPTLERNGYSFDGWFTEQSGGSKITSLSIVSNANDHILYAHWTANTCTIALNAGNGATVTPDHLDRMVGEQYGELPTPNRTGYVFDGWYTLAEGGTKVQNTDTITVAGEQTLYAHWKANRHMISIANIEGVTITKQGNGDYGETITINAEVADGYTFNGWRVKDNVGDEIAVANSSNVQTTFIMPDCNVTITAIINKASYTIAYNLNGGSVATNNPETYDVTTDNITLNNPTKTGYTFAGWTGSNGNVEQTSVTIAKGSTGNRAYTANWTPIMYAITYLLDGGTNNVSNPANYTIDSSAITLLAPTKEGYTFAGWTGSNGSVAQTSVTIAKGSTGNKKYTANWTPISYTIQYTLNGGTVNGTNPTSYTIESQSITLTNPTKTGYTFAGWTGSNGNEAQTSVTIATGSTGNREYIATWTPIEYTISYNLNNGEVAGNNPTSYTIESNAITLINPTRAGYTFAGWTGAGLDAATTTVTIATGSTGNRSYTATWTPIAYTISYDLVGGTVTETNPTSYTIESGPFTLINPTKDGYTFAGWTGTDVIEETITVTIATGSSGDRAYTANWRANVYTITLNNQSATFGGTASIYEKYNVGYYTDSEVAESDRMTTSANGIIVPTREGYEFGGYYTETNGNGTQYIGADGLLTNNANANNFSANGSLYAKWTVNEYTITLNNQSATTAGTAQIYETYGTKFSVTSGGDAMTTSTNGIVIPTRTSYAFGGYYTERNGEGTQIIDANGFIVSGVSTTQFTASTQLYAKWTDAVAPTLTVRKETYKEGFEGWELSGGAYVDNRGLHLPNADSTAKSSYIQADEPWYVIYDAYTTQKAPNSSTLGGSYFSSEYYNTALASVNNNAGAATNDWSKTFNRSEWSNLDYTTEMTGNSNIYGGNIEYAKIELKEHSSYSKNPEDIKNLSIHGQFWTSFYDIIVSASDSESGISAIKYASGERNADYFATNGIVVTGGKVRVTENGTYTVCAEDRGGNRTVQTIVINQIDTTVPTNTAPTYTATANSITVTNGQLDNESGIMKVEYAIKESGGEYGDWQSSNVFTDLISATTYNIKTRSTNKALLVSESQEVTVTTNTVEYTITLDNKGATTAGTEVIYEIYQHRFSLTSGGTAMTSITIPEKTDNMFAGYYTEENGAGVQVIDANGDLTGGATNTLFTENSTIYAKWVASGWLVTFDAQGGTASEPTRIVSAGGKVGTLPTATYEDHIFGGWFTAAQPNGSQISASTAVNGNVTYYAHWTEAVAKINDNYYTSVKNALSTVTDSTPKTIILLKDSSEQLTVANGRNITLDLRTHTLSNSAADKAVIENNGNLTLISGTISCSSTAGAVNVNGTGTFRVTGGSIIATGTKQAVYNNGGIVYIEGGYFSGCAEVTNDTTVRATVHNNSGTMTITGGTIVAPYRKRPNTNKDSGVAVYSKGGNLTVGTKDGTINENSPIISGEYYGLYNGVSVKLYDGNINGKTAGLYNYTGNIGDKETGYNIDRETVGGYEHVVFTQGQVTQYYTVIFNQNGGNLEENLKRKENIRDGTPIGALPVPTLPGYIFLGWFTSANGGTQISETTLVTDNTTYYAHWEETPPAEMDGQEYDTIQDAINHCANGNVIEIKADSTEKLTISAEQEITINLNGHSISNNVGEKILDNNGKLTIVGGDIDSTKATFSAIDNNAKATLILDGVRIIAQAEDSGTQNRQTVYNLGGTVIIKGNSYFESKASGVTGTTPRSTINNLNSKEGDIGRIYIESATIVNTLSQTNNTHNAAISNAAGAIIYIGSGDGIYDPDQVIINSRRYGIFNLGTVYFYDGTIRAKEEIIDGTFTGYDPYHYYETTTEQFILKEGEEAETYKKAYLSPPITITPSTLEEVSSPITATISYSSSIVSGKKAGFGATEADARLAASEETPDLVTITGNGYVYAEDVDTNGAPKWKTIEISNFR